jgi:hypothetical protein
MVNTITGLFTDSRWLHCGYQRQVQLKIFGLVLIRIVIIHHDLESFGRFADSEY